ncbi:hypothetical protein BC829DRAFT_382130 [Chytridium lagenaria]|nr:hypothetical protein BC829DRAFT_382130 [Chytridium lagenaria]
MGYKLEKAKPLLTYGTPVFFLISLILGIVATASSYWFRIVSSRESLGAMGFFKFTKCENDYCAPVTSSIICGTETVKSEACSYFYGGRVTLLMSVLFGALGAITTALFFIQRRTIQARLYALSTLVFITLFTVLQFMSMFMAQDTDFDPAYSNGFALCVGSWVFGIPAIVGAALVYKFNKL